MRRIFAVVPIGPHPPNRSRRQLLTLTPWRPAAAPSARCYGGQRSCTAL